MTDLTYCINTETGDVSEWGIAFYRIWIVNGIMYGFNADGMHELSGKSDGAKPIECSLTISPQDAGTTSLKRVPYARIESTGLSEITLLLDGVECGTAILDATANRAKFARGGRGRYISFKMKSADPAFTLIGMSISEEKQQRGYK